MTTGPLRRDDDEAVHDAGGAVVKTVGERFLAAFAEHLDLPYLARIIINLLLFQPEDPYDHLLAKVAAYRTTGIDFPIHAAETILFL